MPEIPGVFTANFPERVSDCATRCAKPSAPDHSLAGWLQRDAALAGAFREGWVVAVLVLTATNAEIILAERRRRIAAVAVLDAGDALFAFAEGSRAVATVGVYGAFGAFAVATDGRRGSAVSVF